jgi:hypothetical protein
MACWLLVHQQGLASVIAVVAFDAEDAASASFNDFADDAALGSHGVDGDHRALEVELFEHGGDPVALHADEGRGGKIEAKRRRTERPRRPISPIPPALPVAP